MNAIISKINNFIESFYDTITLELILPKDIVLRTQIICKYVSIEINMQFYINDLLDILYEDFMYRYVKNYNPKKMFKELNTDYDFDNIIKIKMNDQIYNCARNNCKKNAVLYKVQKKDTEIAQLALDELYSMFGMKISLSHMITTLWLNFINKYRHGKENDILKELIRMKKKSLYINKLKSCEFR